MILRGKVRWLFYDETGLEIMSQNFTILNIVKVVFGVVAFVSTMGLVYGITNILTYDV